MNHLPDLIRDLGVILVTAAVVTLLFKKLKQPVVLGYLIAGFFLGPHFPYFVTVKDVHSVQIWAEIGVIFLLFGLGLEFSFKKLSRVGKSAGITAFTEAPFMFLLGFLTGKIFGWNNFDCLYVAGALCISSTTIIVRTFEELSLKGKKFVSLVLGVLVFEDLIAILLLVLFTTGAATNTFSSSALFASILKLAFFLTLWFLIGIYLIPWAFSKIRNLLTTETTIVISLGLCLLMVIIVSSVGFSAPLGAFIMGSILAETKEGKNIEHLLNPIKDLFSAVFFVSVGMMIDPHSIAEHISTILLISLIFMCGKVFSISIGAILSGQSLKTSLFTGMSLAQIGEFSFIIATLGMTLKMTSDFLYPVIVAVSALTSFTTPYFVRFSPTLYQWINRHLPRGMQNRLNDYQIAMNNKSEIGLFGLLWKAYGMRILLNLTLVVAIVRLTEKYLMTSLLKFLPDLELLPGIGAIMAIVLSAPFLWAIIYGSHSQASIQTSQHASKLNSLLVGVTTLRIILGILLILGIISHFSTIKGSFFIALLFIAFFMVVFRKSIAPFYHSIENRFIYNLNAKERDELKLLKIKPVLAPWDAVMSEFIVSPHSSIIGMTLKQSALKEKLGVTIALIERGERQIMAPGRDEILMSHDHLDLIGTDAELEEAKIIIEATNYQSPEHETFSDFGLDNIMLSETSRYIHKSIRECGLREDIDGLIVGVERDQKRFLNPDSAMVLRPGDLLWVVADTKKLKQST